MTEYERGVRDGVRFAMTHKETYSLSGVPGQPRVGEYYLSILPNRTNPGEMLPGSAAHREKMIGYWSDAAIAASPETSE